MRRAAKATAVAALVVLMGGGCDSGTSNARHAGPAPADQRSSSPADGAGRLALAKTRIPRCAAQALVLRPGAFVVPMTGEHAVIYALANKGPVTCELSGYPRVVLYDAGGAALPFRYARGGSAYVTSRKPVIVVLARGASAYVLVAKYRCDLGVARNATAIRLTLPTRGAAFAGREALAIAGAAGLSYCRGGPHDPGQVIAVSPVEPTQQATRIFR
jgi:hypothetical protein